MNSKIVFLFLSLLFFACANEQVEESTPELKTEVSAKDTPDPKDNTKLMILCIAKKGLYLNGSYITEKMFEEKIQLFFENVLDNIKIFNVMFFYQDVQPKDYAPLLTTIKEKYQIFLDNKTQEQFGKPYDELKSHEKYSIPYRISFNEIERKFMTESQSTSGLKCH